MKLLALDLGSVTGWALGETGPNATPSFGHWKLKDTVNYPKRGSLARHLRFLFKERGIPDAIVVERPINMPGKTTLQTMDQQRRLHGAVEACAGLWDCEWKDVAFDTARKAVVGRAKAGSRAETKEMVLRAMQLRGLPCQTDDESDACCLWLFGNHCLYQNPEAKLQMYAL